MAQTDWKKFLTSRNNASKRGIDWKLTFKEWLTWWQSTGHYQDRGRGNGKYVMARVGDSGAYELANIFCHKHGDNVRDAQRNKPKKLDHKQKLQDILNQIRKKRKVKTPDGEFESAREAGRYYKITGEAVVWRVKQTQGQFKEWCYADK